MKWAKSLLLFILVYVLHFCFVGMALIHGPSSGPDVPFLKGLVLVLSFPLLQEKYVGSTFLTNNFLYLFVVNSFIWTMIILALIKVVSSIRRRDR